MSYSSRLSNNAILRTYLSTLPIHEQSLDLLADYLYQVGLHHKIDANQDYLAYLKCANAVLPLVDEKSNTITFDRMSLRAKIGTELREG